MNLESSSLRPSEVPVVRRGLSRSVLIGALVCAVVASAAWGQESPTETFEDATSTVLVEVPVEVTLDGEPVRGLTAENFEIIDGGDRQEVIGLDVVDLASLEAEPGRPAAALPVVARRHFLLLFDFSFSKPTAIEKARQAALELVENDLHPADLVAVATHALNAGVRVELAFTPDRSQVAVALAGLGATESVQVRSDPLKLFAGRLDRSIDGDLTNVGGTGSKDRLGMAAEHFSSLQNAANRAQAKQGRREVAIMAQSIGELGTLLRSVDGRKHVVFFSEGFDGDLLLGATDQDRRNEMARQAHTGSVQDLARIDSSEYFGSAESLSVLEDMVEEMRRSDCTIHAVDIGGLRAGGSSGGPAGGGKDGLFMMASGTGGGFYENFNDLGTAMGQMLEKTSVTYVLSYQPSNLKWNGKYRKLKVKLRDVPRKARIVHRPGYFAPDADASVDQGLSTQLDLAQKLWDGREGGSIEARILGVPLRSEARRQGGKAYVPVLLEIDGPSFSRTPTLPENAKKARRGKKNRAAKGAKPSEARAEVFVYALDERGEVADFFSQSIGLGAADRGAAFTDRGMKIYAPLQLDGGDYELRLLVRNSQTGTTGLRVGQVEVPTIESSGPQLLPPFFPESVDAWVLVRGRRQDVDEEKAPPYPFFHGPTVYVPAVDPQLRAGDVLPVFLAGYDLGAVNRLDSEVVDAWGRSVHAPRWRLDDRMQQGEDELQRYVAAFEVPELTPGSYTLHMTLSNAQGEESTRAELSFEILHQGMDPRHQLLTLDSPPDFGPAEAGQAGVAGLGSMGSTRMKSADQEAQSLELPEVEAAYAGILADMGSRWGEPELVAQLVALERQAVGDDAERHWSRLRRTEHKTARRVANRDPELLVPMLMLHTEAYRRHREMRRPYLVHHSQEMVRGLAEDYARLGGTQGSKITAARALASLGGYLQADGRRASVELFDRSLELDPTNEAALLGLAAFHEKRGGPYEESARFLNRLVENRETSREGRLRLAINLLRIASGGSMGSGRLADEAEGHLRLLLDGPEVDWIQSLAAQEAARHLAATKRRDEAIQLLKDAVQRMPGEQKLQVHLTYLLDRARRSSESRRQAMKLVESLDVGAPASRGLYNQWPRQALDADRRELDQGAAQRAAAMVPVAPDPTTDPPIHAPTTQDPTTQDPVSATTEGLR